MRKVSQANLSMISGTKVVHVSAWCKTLYFGPPPLVMSASRAAKGAHCGVGVEHSRLPLPPSLGRFTDHSHSDSKVYSCACTLSAMCNAHCCLVAYYKAENLRFLHRVGILFALRCRLGFRKGG